MALQEATHSLLRRLRVQRRHARPHASFSTAEAAISHDIDDLAPTSFKAPAPTSFVKDFNPLARAAARTTRLPSSGYHFRPPRYYRGPLHPYQPPPPSDPASRQFIPGPFTLPRLQQTYDSALAPDLLALMYTHQPPGTHPAPKPPRLRKWDGDSPYHAGRPLRAPRGAEVLRLLRPPVTFRNVPRLARVTVHSMVKGAVTDSAHLHIAGTVLQQMTNVRATAHMARKAVAGFGVRPRQFLSVTSELRGEDMYHFLAKVVDVVMPRIKDWRGVKGSSGDSSGNIAFGLTAEEVALFPEVEVGYDMFPPKMIPGCHIIVHTTATNDRDARVLLSGIGVPFFGKLVN